MNQITQSMEILRESELHPYVKNAILKTDMLIARGEPVNASAFLVTDKNGIIERANLTLKSGETAVRYKTSFKNGDLSNSKTSFECNF